MNQLDQTLTFLKEITDANAVPGQERQAREVMKKYIGIVPMKFIKITLDH